jgi:4,5-dihydroxyphthalate decarboxylase
MNNTYPTTGPVTLRTNLADYPGTRALKTGEVRSDLVNFDFAGPKAAHEGFKPMVREEAFDAGELAIVTYLQAKAFDKPWALLPAVVMGRFQHQCLLASTARGVRAPKDLEGRRVGVRAYSQTTGVWVRGILQHEYGVDLSRVTWVVNEDAHVAEYREPPEVERVPPPYPPPQAGEGHGGGKKIDQMLLDGELDAAVLGADVPGEPRVRHVIENPNEAARAWAKKHGAVPINHLFVVHAELSRRRPDVVREIYSLLKESKAAAGPPKDGVDFLLFGVEPMRRSLELVTQYAHEQKLIPRRFTVDELFDDTTRDLP